MRPLARPLGSSKPQSPLWKNAIRCRPRQNMLAACCRGMTWQSYCFDNGLTPYRAPDAAPVRYFVRPAMSRRCRKIDLRAPRGRWPGAGKAGVTMSVIAGYTVLFISQGRPAQITVADADESAIERLTVAIFGDVQV